MDLRPQLADSIRRRADSRSSKYASVQVRHCECFPTHREMKPAAPPAKVAAAAHFQGESRERELKNQPLVQGRQGSPSSVLHLVHLVDVAPWITVRIPEAVSQLWGSQGGGWSRQGIFQRMFKMEEIIKGGVVEEKGSSDKGRRERKKRKRTKG